MINTTTLSSDASLDTFSQVDSMLDAIMDAAELAGTQGREITWHLIAQAEARGVIWDKGGVNVGVVAILDTLEVGAERAVATTTWVAREGN